MQIIRKISAIVVASLFASMVVAVPVFADSGPGGGTGGGSHSSDNSLATEDKVTASSETENETETETETEHGTTTSTTTTKTENNGKRADNAKQKVCRVRAVQISGIMNRLVTRADRQITVFDQIASRTEAFYVKKGNTLSNYDALVAAVNDARTTAQADLAAAKTKQSTFTCDSTTPRGAADGFKEALKTEITDLKAYKTAVKNLIVGVKSVNSDDTTKTEGSDQ